MAQVTITKSAVGVERLKEAQVVASHYARSGHDWASPGRCKTSKGSTVIMPITFYGEKPQASHCERILSLLCLSQVMNAHWWAFAWRVPQILKPSNLKPIWEQLNMCGFLLTKYYSQNFHSCSHPFKCNACQCNQLSVTPVTGLFIPFSGFGTVRNFLLGNINIAHTRIYSVKSFNGFVAQLIGVPGSLSSVEASYFFFLPCYCHSLSFPLGCCDRSDYRKHLKYNI